MKAVAIPDLRTEVLGLQQQVARLQALLEASRQLHSTIQLEDIIQSSLQIIVRELEVPGAAIEDPRASYGDMPDEPWDDCIRFPLPDKDGNTLTTLIVAPWPDRALSLYEQDFLEGLVVQLAAAVENARFHRRSLEWARVAQDLEAARAVQRSLVPQRMPATPGYALALRSTACYEVGGDYLDVFRLPSGDVMTIVADVAGKGLASAIVSVSFRSAFRGMAALEGPLAELAANLNDLHWNEGPEAHRRYVTAIMARLSPATHRIEIVNAGHNPGFVGGPDGKIAWVDASGPPLGLIPGIRYISEFHQLAPGGRLLLYTDGLTEVFGPGDDQFGERRLERCFVASRSASCDSVLASLWDAVTEFSEGAPQRDDMSALVLHREELV